MQGQTDEGCAGLSAPCISQPSKAVSSAQGCSGTPATQPGRLAAKNGAAASPRGGDHGAPPITESLAAWASARLPLRSSAMAALGGPLVRGGPSGIQQ